LLVNCAGNPWSWRWCGNFLQRVQLRGYLLGVCHLRRRRTS
jgi:hypothetical protein